MSLNLEDIKYYLYFIKNNIDNNIKMYTLILSILIFYYIPYMFFSIIFVFCLYGVYINIFADLQFDIKINTVRKFKNIKPIDFDKPIEFNSKLE